MIVLRRYWLPIIIGLPALLIVVIGGYWCSKGMAPSSNDMDIDGGCILVALGGAGIIIAIAFARLMPDSRSNEEAV